MSTEPAFPMPAAQFLAGDYLDRADVVLMRGHRPFSKAIRFATNSPFSHAALIFLVPDHEFGFDNTFLIEAVPLGVQVSRLAHALLPQPDGSFHAAVAIMRLADPWFTDDVRSIVRGHTLNFIEAGYDWRTVFGIAASVLRARLFGDSASIPLRLAAALRSARSRNGLAPANFVCSGLVQYGYVRTLYDLARRADAPITMEQARRGLFNPRLADAPFPAMLGDDPDAFATLLSTTPEEISRSPALTWQYVGVNGTVYRVTSRDEAVRLVLRAT